MLEPEFRGSIPASRNDFSFSIILHLNEEMNQKVNNNNNVNSSNSLVFADGRRQKLKRFNYNDWLSITVWGQNVGEAPKASVCLGCFSVASAFPDFFKRANPGLLFVFSKNSAEKSVASRIQTQIFGVECRDPDHYATTKP